MRNDCTVVELSEHNEADDEEAIRRRNRSYASGVGVAQPRSELYVRSRSWKWVVPLQVPQNSTEVRVFLGLVQYIAQFLPKLADHTTILMLLTTKEAHKHFPVWSPEHQFAFEAIKALVVNANCLTVIDHDNPGDNKIFVPCDASDWRTSAVLSQSHMGNSLSSSV